MDPYCSPMTTSVGGFNPTLTANFWQKKTQRHNYKIVKRLGFYFYKKARLLRLALFFLVFFLGFSLVFSRLLFFPFFLLSSFFVYLAFIRGVALAATLVSTLLTLFC